MSPLPILFTIRTQSQGGKFPDDAVDEALQLMLLAVRCGVQYIDVEIEWPEALVSRIMQEKGDAMVVASYHSWTGDVGWTSEVLREKFRAADAFGGNLAFYFEIPLFIGPKILNCTKISSSSQSSPLPSTTATNSRSSYGIT